MNKEKRLNAQAVCLLVIFSATVTISVYQKTGWNIMSAVAPIVTILPFVKCSNGFRNQTFDEKLEKEFGGSLEVCPSAPVGTPAEVILPVKSIASTCLDRYEEHQAELLQREAEHREAVVRAINEYVADITTGYLSKKSLTTLLSNISLLACGETDAYQPLSSDMERKLKSPDFRHLAWNIGERLGVSRAERARFILACFPYELRNATQMYLEAIFVTP